MKLVFDPVALDGLRYWDQTDRKAALKVLRLVDEIQKDPFKGTGKPEPLKFNLAGCWSRRIDQTHRLVYRVEEDTIVILACRYHY